MVTLRLSLRLSVGAVTEMLAVSVSLGEALKCMMPQKGEPDTDVREVLAVSLDRV